MARVLIILIAFCFPVLLQAQDWLEGQLIVKFKESAAQKSEQELLSELKLDPAVYDLERLFPAHQPVARGDQNLGLDRIHQLNFPQSSNIQKLLKKLKSSPYLEYCEPRYLARLAYTPNDPSFSNQNYLNQVSAPAAWDIERGDSNVLIAIVDAGIALNHPDLENQIAVNSADPINGLDDDSDGYIDNYQGWNLVDNNNNVEYTDSDHGVHVAGLAAAEANNGIGVAGLAFGCKIMPLLAGKRIEVSHGYEAIIYAADHGADIINCSWGAYYPSFLGKDAVRYATSQGALIVAAGGNESSEDPYFPAAYEEVMAVVASDAADQKAGLSNYGLYMDIAAPGIALLSTTSRSSYNTRSGTSMSTPLVSAAAALLKSHFPNYSPIEIKEVLKQSSDTIPSTPVNNAYYNKMGNGILNVEAALSHSGAVWYLQDLVLSDRDDERFEQNDTLRLSFNLTSLLASSSNLTLSISSSSSYLEVIDSVYQIATTPQGVEQSFNGLFRIVVKQAPTNTKAELELSLSDGSKQVRKGISLDINTNYLNVRENKLQTTFSSHGMLGYNVYPETEGLGLIYESGASLLYEGGFVVAMRESSGGIRVFDRLRGPGDIGQTDWRIKEAWRPLKNEEALAVCHFDDGTASNAFGLEVQQKVYAKDSTGIDGTIVIEYTISAAPGTPGLDSFYVAQAADFDIGDYQKNKANFDGQRYLAYTYSDESSDQGIYLGLQLLDLEDRLRVYSISAEAGGENGVEIDDNNGFTEIDKYHVLSGSKPAAGLSSGGTDVFQFLTAGPLSISPGNDISLRFALHAARSLDSLKDQADMIYEYFNGAPPTGLVNSEQQSISMYPNPSEGQLFIKAERINEVVIRALDGRTVLIAQPSEVNGRLYKMNLGEVKAGVYLVEIYAASAQYFQKLVIK